MSEMERLAALFTELKDAIAKCSKCGSCQSVCPLYIQTKNENDVARGKLALLDAIGHKMFDEPDGVLKRLNRCLLCGACAANCANGVDALGIFLKARMILSEFAGLSWTKKLIFKRIIADPKTFEKWAKRGTRLQKWVSKPENPSLGTVSMRFSSVLGQRHFLPLADTSFDRLIREVPPKADASHGNVLFYPGCLINHVFPHVGLAAHKALIHSNVNVSIPRVQSCCGMPAVSAGDGETAKKLIFQNLRELRHFKFDQLITACPTCAYAIKEVWPMIAGNMDMTTEPDIASTLDHVIHHTADISQFIVQHHHLAKDPIHPNPDAQSVTYHDPCHLKKSLGVHIEPRMLIQSNPNYQLKEMRQADKCCGMGGSFGIEQLDLSNAIGKAKYTNIMDTQCEVVASGCPACMMQLSHLLSKSNANISVKHPVEIYSELLIK